MKPTLVKQIPLHSRFFQNHTLFSLIPVQTRNFSSWNGRPRINPNSPLLNEDLQKKELLDSYLRSNHTALSSFQSLASGQSLFLSDLVQDFMKNKKLEQDEKHFNQVFLERRVRPTLFLPIFNTVAYGVGATSALLGKEMALFLQMSVKDALSEHYDDQLRHMNELGYTTDSEDIELREVIKKNRDVDIDLLSPNEAKQPNVPFNETLSMIVRTGTKFALWLSSSL